MVHLIAVIMYRLFLCHYSLLVDEKNELYRSLLLKVIMLYKYWDGRAEHVQQGWWFKPHSCRTV